MSTFSWLLDRLVPSPFRLSNPVNHGLVAGYVVVGYLIHDFKTPQAIQWGLMAVTVMGLVGWWMMLRRSKAYALEATSRIATAAQGYVELQGRGLANLTSSMCSSPVTMRPCIWFRTTLYRRSLLDKDWKLTDEGLTLTSFVLDDGSGRCVVNTEGAEMLGLTSYTTEQGDERWVEEILKPDTTLTLLGEFKTVGDPASTRPITQEVGELLGEWKRDSKRLLQRFDLNHDGVIDLKEWELARKLAQSTVQHNRANTPLTTATHTLSAPSSGALFLISTYSPRWARVYFLAWSGLHLLLGVGAIVVLSKLHMPH